MFQFLLIASLTFPWAPLGKAWFSLLYFLPHQVFIHTDTVTQVFSYPG